jgi:hypothetical protein
MITKLIIFDLDGVLIDSKDTHYVSLNKAIEDVAPDFVISYEEHISTFDGLPTIKKLEKLTSMKGLNPSLHEEITIRKKQYTAEYLSKIIKPDSSITELLTNLKQSGYIIHLASNAIRDTVLQVTDSMEITRFFDFIISNTEVKYPKPNPEIYLRCMIEAGVSPLETLIVEDSYIGRQAVKNSGAKLCPVKNSKQTTLERITLFLNKNSSSKCIWEDSSINVLIPMAGAGSRFQKAGYTFPKPLIEVQGKPMIQVVIESLGIKANYIYIVQKSHFEQYQLNYLLNMITPNCKIVCIDGITEGAACTTLLAKHYIDNDNPLLIVNSDQYIEWDSCDFMYKVQETNVDGCILTFKSTHPKWSYVILDKNGFVISVHEKQVVSSDATVGIYYFKNGSDYVKCAEKMIKDDKRVNGEFYVCPVYNETIEKGGKITIYQVDKMYGIGTPEDLNTFLSYVKL